MLMNLYRCRVVLMVLALLVACLQAGNSVAMASPLHVLGGEGVVIGHIDRCSGLPLPGGPEYSAGIVTVLRGQITWISQGHGNRKPVFPRRVAGKARVTTYGSYRFVLPPRALRLHRALAALQRCALRAGDCEAGSAASCRHSKHLQVARGTLRHNGQLKL